MSLLAAVRDRLDLIPDEHPGAGDDTATTQWLLTARTGPIGRVPAAVVALLAAPVQQARDKRAAAARARAAARTRRWLRIDPAPTSKES